MLVSMFAVSSVADSKTIRYGKVALDGYMDTRYASSATLTTMSRQTDDVASVADVTAVETRMLIDYDYLYIYTKVTDPEIVDGDGVGMFFAYNGKYEAFTVYSNGSVSVSDVTLFEANNLLVSAVKYPDYYAVEVAIPLTFTYKSGTKFGYHTLITNANAAGDSEQYILGNFFNDSYTIYITSTDASLPAPNTRIWPAEGGVYYDVDPGTSIADFTATIPTAVTITDVNGQPVTDTSLPVGNGMVFSDGTFSSTVLIKGDPNGNGEVESNDAATIRTFFLNGTKLDALRMEVSDLNFNGKLDSNDYIIMRRYIMGLIDTLPDPYPVPESETYSVKYYGATGNGTTDDTAAIQAALNASSTVFFPAGIYRITSELTVPNNRTIYGVGERAVIRTISNSSVFVAKGQYVNVSTTAVHPENISISDLRIVSPTLKQKYAVDTSTINNLTVDNLIVRNMGGVMVGTVYPINVWDETENPYATAGLDSDDDLSHNITVTNCDIDCGSYGDNAANGVTVSYVNTFAVNNNVINNAWQGVQAWGGDSDRNRGGSIELTWQCCNGEILNNYVADIGGGGCWASLGKNIAIDNNEIYRCRDVGVDFEGCTDVTASYNKVYNCSVGNFATFQYCLGNVTFTHNESYMIDNSALHYFNSNASLANAQQNVVFDSNYFYSNGQNYVSTNSALQYFTFTNNTCVNTGVRTTGLNVKNVNISGNTFTLDENFAGGEETYVVYAHQSVSAATMKVNNNTVTNNGSPVARGLLIVHDNNLVGNAEVMNNNCSGFSTADIYIAVNTSYALNVWYSGNTGTLQSNGTINYK